MKTLERPKESHGGLPEANVFTYMRLTGSSDCAARGPEHAPLATVKNILEGATVNVVASESLKVIQTLI